MRVRLLAFGGRVALLALLLVPHVAHAAEPNGDAEKLFQEARALTEQGKYAEACPKLEESQRLEPAVGTEFNLADCYEHVGRVASAWLRFNEVARIARAAGKAERDKSASDRAAALEPRLPRLRFVMNAKAPGLEVVLDGETLTAATLEKPLPVDPGTHAVLARAPGRKEAKQTTTAIEGRTTDVLIGALADDGTTKPPNEGMPTRKKIAIGVLAAGGAAAVVGGVFGVLSLTHRSNARASCPEEQYAFRCPTQEGSDSWNAAVTTGNVSTIAFIVAGALLAGGAALWLTAPRANGSAQTRGSLLLQGPTTIVSF